MCTATTLKALDYYIGRNLDYEFSYGEQIVITPRNYLFKFRHKEYLKQHYAIIGMAHVVDDIPLYYDACNEKGLGIAGLNFVNNAYYHPIKQDKNNIASFELIWWLLAKCANVDEVITELNNMNICNDAFSDKLPPSQLHWLISDGKKDIVVEAMIDGIKIYEDHAHVLTNNPPFDKMLFKLNDYMSLSNKQPENTFGKELELEYYSRGMGGIGLPGDLSSASRFVKAAFIRSNIIAKDNEEDSVSQFFHILTSVEQQEGCCEVEKDKYEYTIYSSCMNLNKGIYYYKTYNNHQIMAVDMYHEDLNSHNIICYPMEDKCKIIYQN